MSLSLNLIRRLVSLADPDSDPDFNPGAVPFSPPPKEKRKLTRKRGQDGPSTSRPRGRKPKVEAFSSEIKGGKREKSKDLRSAIAGLATDLLA